MSACRTLEINRRPEPDAMIAGEVGEDEELVELKRSKVLVLDEATSSVDAKTDNMIQEAMREGGGFAGSTVIVVAHRITSIIDSDVVLVLGHGVVMERGSPLTLLQNRASSFAKLVAQYTTCQARSAKRVNSSSISDNCVKEQLCNT
ncbi:hypothetical protein DM860_004415 [Cuscuta australis]|uniref:ABC transporter domain-containing protein n=1 Tax=Cuscuta australis TaxID=267555 RepID=A0A328E7H2_9ASTE|nr:hypothetical protein DM860_004415 [Cuscuta australis]